MLKASRGQVSVAVLLQLLTHCWTSAETLGGNDSHERVCIVPAVGRALSVLAFV